MASLAVRSAVESRIRDNFVRCPLHAPNSVLELPSDGSPILELQFPLSNEDILSIGDPLNRLYREEGAIRLVLCAKVGTGSDEALAWIDELRDLFRGQEFGGVVTLAPSPPVEANDNESGNYYRLSVAIPYYFDLVSVDGAVLLESGVPLLLDP